MPDSCGNPDSLKAVPGSFVYTPDVSTHRGGTGANIMGHTAATVGGVVKSNSTVNNGSVLVGFGRRLNCDGFQKLL